MDKKHTNIKAIEQVVTDIYDYEINLSWFSDPGIFRVRAVEVDVILRSTINLEVFVKSS